MAGFTGWRIPLFLRRGLTMLPSLIILGAGVNTTDALVYSQVALSFGIPFALVPLVLITRRASVMGDMVNRRSTTTVMVAITTVISLLNIYLLYDTVAGLL